jgi:hypothetical protein
MAQGVQAPVLPKKKKRIKALSMFNGSQTIMTIIFIDAQMVLYLASGSLL